MSRRLDEWMRRLPPGWSIQRRNVNPLKLRDGDTVRIRGPRGYRNVSKVFALPGRYSGDPILHVFIGPWTVESTTAVLTAHQLADKSRNLRVDLYKDGR